MANNQPLTYLRDGISLPHALARTTHLIIAAHPDDAEIMAFSAIKECYADPKKFLTVIICADGANSVRKGRFLDYTDEQMISARQLEQLEAAKLGRYQVLLMLNQSSASIQNPNDPLLQHQLEVYLRGMQPEKVFIHNPFDRHLTHVSTVLKAIKTFRNINFHTKQLLACEVWRDLDWVQPADKINLDSSDETTLSRDLIACHESQIEGGKNYIEATIGRRIADATFSESHQLDSYTAITYALDLTPLLKSKSGIARYLKRYIRNFEINALTPFYTNI
jgi:LmbE family N-acetylglucosaminyl deacetylase